MVRDRHSVAMDNGKSCVDFRIPQLPVTLNDLDLTRVDCVSGGAICVQQLVYTVVDAVGPRRGNITNRRSNKQTNMAQIQYRSSLSAGR